MCVAFANAKATHIFFQQKYLIFTNQSFKDMLTKDMLTNDILSFEQLGPGYPCNLHSRSLCESITWEQRPQTLQK